MPVLLGYVRISFGARAQQQQREQEAVVKFKSLAALAAVGVLAACTPKIDGSSEAALNASLKKVLESVPEGERPALIADLNFLTPELNGALMMARIQPAAAGEIVSKATANINGLTADEVRAKAPPLKAAAAAKKKADEINSLQAVIASKEKEIADLEKAQASLAKISAQVVRTVPASSDVPFGAVELDVKNGMEMKAHRVWFTLDVEGFSQPTWARDAVLEQDIPPGASGRSLISLGDGLMGYGRTVKITGVRITAVEGGGPYQAADHGQRIASLRYDVQGLQKELKAAQ